MYKLPSFKLEYHVYFEVYITMGFVVKCSASHIDVFLACSACAVISLSASKIISLIMNFS